MPAGRPPSLDKIVMHRTAPSGETVPVTASQRVVELTGIGLPADQVAASAGLARSTLIYWRRQAAIAHGKIVAGQKLTASDRRYLEFSVNLARAEADAELSRLSVIFGAATRGSSTTTVTEELIPDPANVGQWIVGSRKVVTKTSPPDWGAAKWWLERRIPQRYAPRSVIEMTGHGDPMPRAERAANLAEQAAAYLAGVNDGTPADA